MLNHTVQCVKSIESREERRILSSSFKHKTKSPRSIASRTVNGEKSWTFTGISNKFALTGCNPADRDFYEDFQVRTFPILLVWGLLVYLKLPRYIEVNISASC